MITHTYWNIVVNYIQLPMLRSCITGTSRCWNRIHALEKCVWGGREGRVLGIHEERGWGEEGAEEERKEMYYVVYERAEPTWINSLYDMYNKLDYTNDE